jgi:hypothetical protein
MPRITVEVDQDLKARMDDHPDAEWEAISRQAIRTRLEKLELMADLTADAELADADAEELAAKVDEIARRRIEAESP